METSGRALDGETEVAVGHALMLRAVRNDLVWEKKRRETGLLRGRPAEDPVRRHGAVQGMWSVHKFAEWVVGKLKQAERPSLQDVNREHFLSGAGCRPKRKAHVGKLQVCRLAEGRLTTNAKAEKRKFAE